VRAVLLGIATVEQQYKRLHNNDTTQKDNGTSRFEARRKQTKANKNERIEQETNFNQLLDRREIDRNRSVLDGFCLFLTVRRYLFPAFSAVG